MLNDPTVWYLMRSTGVVSTLLLTIVVALGVATSMRWKLAGLPRAVTVGVHRSASLLAVVVVAIHVATAVVDPDAAVSLLSLVVPFAGSAQPLWVGLGALSVELVAAVLVTSLLRRHFSRRAWRAIHWLAYAAWPLALVHGIGMGTDNGTAWLTAVNLACVAAVGAAVTWRLYAAGEPVTVAPRRQAPLLESSYARPRGFPAVYARAANADPPAPAAQGGATSAAPPLPGPPSPS